MLQTWRRFGEWTHFCGRIGDALKIQKRLLRTLKRFLKSSFLCNAQEVRLAWVSVYNQYFSRLRIQEVECDLNCLQDSCLDMNFALRRSIWDSNRVQIEHSFESPIRWSHSSVGCGWKKKVQMVRSKVLALKFGSRPRSSVTYMVYTGMYTAHCAGICRFYAIETHRALCLLSRDKDSWISRPEFKLKILEHQVMQDVRIRGWGVHIENV